MSYPSVGSRFSEAEIYIFTTNERHRGCRVALIFIKGLYIHTCFSTSYIPNMIIFEKQTVYTDDENGSSLLDGMNIVFGEENTFEERFYTTVTLEVLGFAPEDAPDLNKEKILNALSAVDLERLTSSANRIALKDIFPDFDPQTFTEAPQDVLDGAFLKTQSLLVPFPGLEKFHPLIKRDVLTEALACEALLRSPCPYIATYLGCQVQGNRITGFYYERCKEILRKPQPWDDMVPKYIADIRKGIEHLHSLGFCHNDVSAGNIMLRDDDTAVLIDLDSCLPMGEALGKVGTNCFHGDEEYCFYRKEIEHPVSEVENDWYGIAKVEEFLLKYAATL